MGNFKVMDRPEVVGADDFVRKMFEESRNFAIYTREQGAFATSNVSEIVGEFTDAWPKFHGYTDEESVLGYIEEVVRGIQELGNLREEPNTVFVSTSWYAGTMWWGKFSLVSISGNFDGWGKGTGSIQVPLRVMDKSIVQFATLEIDEHSNAEEAKEYYKVTRVLAT